MPLFRPQVSCLPRNLCDGGVISRTATSGPPEGVEGLREVGLIVPMIKDYRVQVGGHDDVSVDAQLFMRAAEGETSVGRVAWSGDRATT